MERPRIKDYTHLRYIDKAHYIDYSDALNKYIDHQATEITSLKEQLEKERELIERCKNAVQHTTKDRSLLCDIEQFLTQNQSNDEA